MICHLEIKPSFSIFIDYKKISPLFEFSWYITKQTLKSSSFIPKRFSFFHCYYVEPVSPTMCTALYDTYPSREHKGSGKVKETCYLAAWFTRQPERLKIPSSHRYHMHEASGYTYGVTPQVSLLCIKKDLVQNAGGGFYESFRVRAEFCNLYQVLESSTKYLYLFLNWPLLPSPEKMYSFCLVWRLWNSGSRTESK